ncbi:MAG: TonB-dependent receptor [Caulobacteraceae bacterium]|nr:TonB-dependent receptor [Caulobacteraceae bacterium]
MAFALSVAGTAAAQDLVFNIPAESLSKALRDYGRASGRQLIFTEDLVRGLKAPAVRGSFTAEQVLARLLQGSGLTAQVSDKGVIMIVRAPGRSAANGAAALDEVVVTAQKRAENVGKVPISIAVLSGRRLDSVTLQGTTSILNQVPGVTAAPAQFGGSTQITIRGVTAATPTYDGASPTAYYIDSVPFGFVSSAIAPDPNAYDLERVEVLRGPQGTLYGASSEGGVVRILTHDADFNVFEAKARTSVSSTEFGGTNGGFDAAVNVPLIQDKLAARFVVGYASDSGWIDRTNRRDANGDHLLNLRLKLNAQPTDRLSIALSLWHSQSNYAEVPRGDSTTFDNEHAGDPLRTGFDTAGLKISYAFPWFSLTSATSFLTYRDKFFQDVPPYGDLYTTFPAKTLSQELYLNSSTPGPWRWTAGLAYRDSTDKTNQTLGTIEPPDTTSAESRSFAVFGQLTRLFLDDKVELTGGLRYFVDNVIQLELGPNYVNSDGKPTNTNVTYRHLSPKLSLTWHVTDDVTTYASYSEGFRSGFTQGTLLGVAALPAARPDTLDNYEVGAKGRITSRLSFDAAAYYIHWADVQSPITLLVPGTTNLYDAAVLNGKSASGPGVEAELKFLVFTGLNASLNYAWNNLTEDANVVDTSSTFPNGVVVFAKGSRLDYSPQMSAGFSLDYVTSLPLDGYSLRLAGSGNYISSERLVRFRGSYVEITTAPPSFESQISAALVSKDNWTATLFVNNVGRSAGQPFLDHPGPFVGGVFERPRTVGLQLEYHY